MTKETDVIRFLKFLLNVQSPFLGIGLTLVHIDCEREQKSQNKNSSKVTLALKDILLEVFRTHCDHSGHLTSGLTKVYLTPIRKSNCQSYFEDACGKFCSFYTPVQRTTWFTTSFAEIIVKATTSTCVSELFT